jgi:hypothetical protein
MGFVKEAKKQKNPDAPLVELVKTGARDIAPVPDADLAVNECNSSCEQKDGGICIGLPDCQPNITPAIVRSCSDASFSCTPGYTACKKDGAIWCYGSGSGSGGGKGVPALPQPQQLQYFFLELYLVQQVLFPDLMFLLDMELAFVLPQP